MWKLKLNIVLAHGHKHLTIVGFLFMVIFVHTASMRNVPLAADSPDVIEISLDNESNVKHSVPVNSKVVLKCDLANNSWFKDGTRLTVETKKPSQFKIERVKRIDDGIYECRSSRGIIRTVRFEVTSSSELTVSDSLDHGTKSVNKFFEDDNEQTDDQDSRSSDENNADDFNDNAEIDEEEDDDYNYYDDTETTKNLHEGFPRFLHVDNMFKQIKHFTGDKVRIKCKADGTPLPNITWTKDNEPINTNRQARYGSWSVALSDLSVNDSGDYNCKVCNIHGCIDYSSKLIVRELQVKSHTSNLTNNDEDDEDKDALANKPSMPRFIKRSDMDEIVAKPSGNMVRIKCAATGNPLPNITWTKDNQNISRSMGVVKYGKWSIVLEDLIPKDTGEYKCLVCNEHGCIHHISKLQVRERFPSGPIIKENYPKNQTVLDGSDAMMECAYLGVDLTVYTQWVRNTINATDRGGVPKNATILKGNPDRPELLVLQNITYENEGWYTCIAANSLGQSVASAYLHVVDELSEDPIQAPIKPHSKWISIIAFGLGALFLVALGIMCFTFKRLKHEKLMKHRAMETVHQWTKKVIILKPSSDVSNPEAVVQIPIVKIEKQRTTLIQSSNCDAGPFNEYEFPLDSNWEFSRSQLSLGPTLGEGAFGRVIMAEAHGLVKNGMETIVAVKMVKEGHTDADMTSLVQEMEVMKMIGKHINIINLLGCCSQDGPLYVIVEYAPHGNLKDFLKKNRPTSEYEVGIADDKDRKNLTQKDLISFAFQVARGMEYLASRRCIHRDLAARNVLVSDDYVVKIADFGLARDIQESEYYRKNTNGRLPIKWMAPESLRDKFYDSQSDVWSYGVLLWEIMNYGEQPYPQVYSSEHLYEFLWAGNRMEKPQRCSYNIYMLMRQCWNFDPHERPTFTEIVENLDKILGATANEEYLDLGVPLLETPPSSDDESDAETLREHSPLRYNF